MDPNDQVPDETPVEVYEQLLLDFDPESRTCT